MEAAAQHQVPGDRLLPAALRGPRLQLLNLSVLYTVVVATVDYPNALPAVVASAAWAAALDGVVSRIRYGAWRFPYGSVIGTLGAWLVLDGFTWLPFALVPTVVVAVRHAARWRGTQVLNANNFAMCVLLVAGLVRVGVNDWGAAPQTVLLMVLFGTVATVRVGRLDTAVMYLVVGFVVFVAAAWWTGRVGEDILRDAWMWALSPLHVMLGFFALTDPATSPGRGRATKLLFVLLVVLLSVPATLAGHIEAPILALLVAAPQRHLLERAVRSVRRQTRAQPVAVGGAT